MRIASLYRYPVKGLTPERLPRVMLERGGYFPGDRLFAVENGPSGFDPSAPEHQPKIKFLQLMRHAALARLTARYDDASGMLGLSENGRQLAQGVLATEAGRAAIEQGLSAFMPAGELRGPLKLLAAPRGFRFTDSRSGFVSLINLATVSAIEQRIGAPLDPLRFRGNLHIEGLGPWAEFDLVGRSFEGPSGVRLTISKRIDRCAATEVDPVTAMRDLPVVRTLMNGWGHPDCGVYAEISASGTLSEGQRLVMVDEARPGGLGLR